MKDVLKASTVALYCARKLHEAEVADLIELFDINGIPKEYIGEMAKDLLLALDARRSYTYCWLVKEHEGYRELPPIDLRQMDYTPGARAV